MSGENLSTLRLQLLRLRLNIPVTAAASTARSRRDALDMKTAEGSSGVQDRMKSKREKRTSKLSTKGFKGKVVRNPWKVDGKRIEMVWHRHDLRKPFPIAKTSNGLKLKRMFGRRSAHIQHVTQQDSAMP